MTFIMFNSGGYADCSGGQIQIRDLTLADVAIGLMSQQRFGGQMHGAYNVLEHSMLVGDAMRDLGPRLALMGYMHDAAEILICDIPSPVKKLSPEIQALEKQILDAIFDVFDIPHMTTDEAEEVKRYDHAALVQEVEQFEGAYPQWAAWAETQSVSAMAYLMTFKTPLRKAGFYDFVSTVESLK